MKKKKQTLALVVLILFLIASVANATSPAPPPPPGGPGEPPAASIDQFKDFLFLFSILFGVFCLKNNTDKQIESSFSKQNRM